MFKNYLIIALRNLRKNKTTSFINIIGLSAGMAVVILICLWLWDEISFDKQNPNSSHIARVIQNVKNNGGIETWQVVPEPLAEELRHSYAADFKNVVMASWTDSHMLSVGNAKFNKTGAFFEAGGPALLNLDMVKGNWQGLTDPYSILLSAAVAKAIFGDTDPINRVIKMDGQFDVKVTGVYKDLPVNSSFADITFISPWKLNLVENPWIKQPANPWRSNSFNLYAELADNADMQKVSRKIKDVKLHFIHKDELANNPQLFLYPMNKWHLHSEFKNGVNTGGRIQYVWLIGIIGAFVLLLACINFMNLSTARSEKRAKEVGIRKAVGSLRRQLVQQFFTESILVALLSFIISLGIVLLLLPFFNSVSGKNITVPWGARAFWLSCIGFAVITGLIAGSYPALYLSSFKPVKILKGNFKAGSFAGIPRKILVVFQFSVSVSLIIATIVIFRQIQFAKNRPVGYSRDGLVLLPMQTADIHNHFDAFKNDLLATGAVLSIAESSASTTNVTSTNSGFEWRGKATGQAIDFPNTDVSYDFGKTVGWQFIAGRDFSKAFGGDTKAFVINETAAKFMGLPNPVGEVVRWDGVPYTIVGVIKNMLVESPYEPVRPSFYHISTDPQSYTVVKLNPAAPPHNALALIETAYKKFNTDQPFEYKFADAEYDKKFGSEERVGKLSTFFAVLAIFISCLGLFGMASFMAEQRIKEIGIRKVLGASTFNLWGMLSKDFVTLVIISLLISLPTGYYFMNKWLLQYQYHANQPWWIFMSASVGALTITLFTVSYQSIKTALANPVKSLKTE